MAPGSQGFKLPIVVACLALIGAVRDVMGSGHIEIHFIRYTDNCQEDLGSNKCDPMFSFCLSTPQIGRLSVENCNYQSTGESSSHYHNTNHVELEHQTSILGHKNPWVVEVNKFIEPSVMLVIKVRDADIFIHDHMQTWAITLTETIWPTKEQSVWIERVMTSNSYAMRFRVRMYCDPFYHTSKCDVYCKPEDSSVGHYTCDSVTGIKTCLPGWQGTLCTQDIDECSRGYCVNGECTNLPGDYTCHCPTNYMDKNCSTLMNPCRSQPCQNGGTCFAHALEHRYICQCSQEWEGANCQIKKDHCRSNPCQNNGSCTNSLDKTSYNCSCVYPYSGVNCEGASASTSLETTQSSTSTMETTQSSTTTTTSTTKTPDTPKPPLATNKMADESSTTLSEFDTNVEQIIQKNDEDSFHLWYIAIIVAILLIVLIVVAIFLIKRRKQKASQELMQTNQNVSFDGAHLSFENGMYNNANRSNSETERRTGQLPPVPTNPNEEELFNPIKPAYAEVDETRGAMGGIKDDVSDLKAKPSAKLLKASDPSLGSLTRPLSERAQTNPYADFKSLKDSQTKENYPDNESHNDEGHYHDLDEIVAAMRQDEHDDNTMRQDERDDNSDGAFNYTIQETPVVTVQGSPYDFPSNNSCIYATPRPTSLAPVHNNDLIKDIDLTKDWNLTNKLTPRTDVDVSADDPYNDSSDEDIVQEDLAQLRKAVEENMKPNGSLDV